MIRHEKSAQDGDIHFNLGAYFLKGSGLHLQAAGL